MDIYTASEQAYKNGYEAGVKLQQEEMQKLKSDIQECNILIDMQDKMLREQTEKIERLNKMQLLNVSNSEAFIKIISEMTVEKFVNELKEHYGQADILCPRRIVSVTYKELDNIVEKFKEGVKTNGRD